MCYKLKTGPGCDDCPLVIPCVLLCQNPPDQDPPPPADPEPTDDEA